MSAPVVDDLRAVAEILAAGGVVAVPTDTVYGLACDPRSEAAVDRVYAIKRRPQGMELSILGAEVEDLAAHGALDERARRLGAAFWPGPLSLVVPVARPGAFAVPRCGASVSVRIPDSDVLRALLRLTGPLATTSANRHGAAPASSPGEVGAALGADVDAVLDGPPAGGRPSTIIDLSEAPPRVLRAGPLSIEALRPHLGAGLSTHPGAHPSPRPRAVSRGAPNPARRPRP